MPSSSIQKPGHHPDWFPCLDLLLPVHHLLLLILPPEYLLALCPSFHPSWSPFSPTWVSTTFNIFRLPLELPPPLYSLHCVYLSLSNYASNYATVLLRILLWLSTASLNLLQLGRWELALFSSATLFFPVTLSYLFSGPLPVRFPLVSLSSITSVTAQHHEIFPREASLIPKLCTISQFDDCRGPVPNPVPLWSQCIMISYVLVSISQLDGVFVVGCVLAI